MEISDFKITEEAIKERLASGDVYFSYLKKDGTVREAYGTRDTNIINEYNAAPKGNSSEKDGVITYYDIEFEGWRSFKIDNFIGFNDICAA